MNIENKKTIDNYITEWYEWMRGEVGKNITKNQMTEYRDDLIHHVLQDVYRMDEEKTLSMIENGKLRWYILTACGIQLRSKTSTFYRTHRKTKNQSRENWGDGDGEHYNHIGMGILDQIYEPYEGDPFMECLQDQMEKLHWYQKTLMNRYWIEGWSLTKMYKHYNISKTHIINDLNEAMRTIRENCKNCNN